MGCGLRCCSAAWACTLLFDLPAVACQKVSAACDEWQRVGAEVVVCDAELSDAATVADNFDLRDRKLKGLPIVPETALCHSRAISFQRGSRHAHPQLRRRDPCRWQRLD